MDFDKSYQLPFSPLVVFDAWISPQTIIAPITRIEIDPVAGGHFRLFIEASDYSSRNEGTYMAVVPGSHLKYTWEWNGDGKVTDVTVDFSATAEGSQIRIQHCGFHDLESLQMHSTGWDCYIEGLAEILSRKNKV